MPACPEWNNRQYTANGVTFEILCNTDNDGNLIDATKHYRLKKRHCLYWNADFWLIDIDHIEPFHSLAFGDIYNFHVIVGLFLEWFNLFPGYFIDRVIAKCLNPLNWIVICLGYFYFYIIRRRNFDNDHSHNQ
ncbi:hypothetical protein SLS58_002609 [Diplodia intermedia]|uniref:Uncharacterized protein n=1 Tax=Diplodia intermedia TaxID=856260 RepID=A0ABR3TZT8_9PEZI